MMFSPTLGKMVDEALQLGWREAADERVLDGLGIRVVQLLAQP
jgi:hypothetical protein